jgi:hypothetical protein
VNRVSNNLKQLHCLIPPDASIGDALTVGELLQGAKFLPTSYEMAFFVLS